MKYYIDYHTGIGNDEIDGTIDEAMAAAEAAAAYTQQDITIYDESNTEIARLPWWGVAYDEETGDVNTADFGTFGYYGEWIMGGN